MEGFQAVSIREYSGTFTGVDLPIGFSVDSILVKGVGLTIQKQRPHVVVEGPGEFELTASLSEILRVIETRLPAGLKNLRLRFESGKIYVEVTKTLIVDLKVKAICAIRIQDRSSIYIDMESGDVMGAPILQLLQSQLDKINPVFDASKLPFPAQIDRIELLDAQLKVFGQVSPPL